MNNVVTEELCIHCSAYLYDGGVDGLCQDCLSYTEAATEVTWGNTGFYSGYYDYPLGFAGSYGDGQSAQLNVMDLLAACQHAAHITGPHHDFQAVLDEDWNWGMAPDWASMSWELEAA